MPTHSRLRSAQRFKSRQGLGLSAKSQDIQMSHKLLAYAMVATTASHRGVSGDEKPRSANRPPVIVPQCVVSSGQSERTTRRRFGPDETCAELATRSGTCSIGAPASRSQGVETPGDGLVDIECKAGRCVCRIEVFQSDSKSVRVSSRSRVIVWTPTVRTHC